jgi:hypothetical protein
VTRALNYNIFVGQRHYIGKTVACERTRSARQLVRRIAFEGSFPGSTSLNKSYAKKPGNGIQRYMSEERFTERKTDVSNATRRLIEAVKQPESDILRDADQHIVDSYAELLGTMADKIQGLAWD